MPAPWQPCRGSREALQAAHLARARQGNEHGGLRTQRLRAGETGAFKERGGGHDHTWASQLWAGKMDWHAAVNRRVHVNL